MVTRKTLELPCEPSTSVLVGVVGFALSVEMILVGLVGLAV